MADDPGFTHNGVNENYEGTPKAITKIVMDGGMVTELETADIPAGVDVVKTAGAGFHKIDSITIENGIITAIEWS